MIISLINHTNGKLTDEEVQNTIRAINRQTKEDYEPYWSLGATLRLEGKAGAKPKQQEPSDIHLIPKVKKRIAAEVRRLLLLGFGARLSFEPQRRSQTPVWLVVLFSLSVYDPNGVLHLLVG